MEGEPCDDKRHQVNSDSKLLWMRIQLSGPEKMEYVHLIAQKSGIFSKNQEIEMKGQHEKLRYSRHKRLRTTRKSAK